MTIKRGERAVIGLLLVQKCRLPPPKKKKKKLAFLAACWGPLLAKPGTIYYCLGAKI